MQFTLNFIIIDGAINAKRMIMEKLLLIKRADEELALLLREMKDHVKYYRCCIIPELQAREQEMNEKLLSASSKLDLIFFRCF